VWRGEPAPGSSPSTCRPETTKPTLTSLRKGVPGSLFHRHRRGRQRSPRAARVSARGHDVRLWIDGLLAGRYSRITADPPKRTAKDGPLVLWAVADRKRRRVRVATWPAGSAVPSWFNMGRHGAGGAGRCPRRAGDHGARSATAGRRTLTAPGSGIACHSADAPALDGDPVHAVLGIGDRAYMAHFCGPREGDSTCAGSAALGCPRRGYWNAPDW